MRQHRPNKAELRRAKRKPSARRLAAPPGRIAGSPALTSALLQQLHADTVAALHRRGTVRSRRRGRRYTLAVPADWQAAQVVRDEPVAVGFEEASSAVVGNAHVGLVALVIAHGKSLRAGVDGRDGLCLGEVSQRAGGAIIAADGGDAPIWGMCNTDEINQFVLLVAAFRRILASYLPGLLGRNDGFLPLTM